RLLGCVLGGARWLADEHDAFRPGNWQLVGACTLLSAGVLFPELAESADWVATGRARITEHLVRDVHPDGGHHERSPGYHRLCLEFLHRVAPLAERYLDWPLGADERVVAMCDWLVAMATPEGWLPPFQDTGHEAAGPYLVAGHRWAPKPEYKALAAATMEPAAVASLLGAEPDRDGVPAAQAWASAPAADPPARGVWLSGSRYFVSRSDWRPGSLYAAVNCGPRVPHELESHSHRACLDVVLWGHGQPLAWEAGGPADYDDPEYHDWYQSSEAHSSVVFPGRSPDLEAGAAVSAVVLRPSLDALVAHHDGWGVRHRRTFLAVRPAGELPGYWLLRDEVPAAGWRWLLHGRGPWRRTGPATFVSVEPPGLLVHVPGDWTATTRVGRTSYPTPSGPCWGELHCLELTPGADVLTALLVPFADEPPEVGEVTVTEPAPGQLRITWPTATDELAPGRWTRRGGLDDSAVSLT
ncbi:MAG: heparinase II/III family protein, partial [Actinophytocola sp.]|uniref:heparinase II/III family protein n=1 Tax=Actinophytocola sp. TaxID=1872138 RepID=UPI003D6B7D26